MGNVVTIAGAALPKPAAKAGKWMKWEGGRYWLTADGRRSYYIRRRIDGHLFQVKTGATSERAAFAQLERFLANPGVYDPKGEEQLAPIFLDEELAKDFLTWSKLPKKEGGAGNTLRWVTQQRLYLAAWAEHLKGVNLRKASLRDDIEPALKGSTCRPQRIAVIKRLYSWLRKVDRRLSAAEDPTLNTLSVPQYEPAQHTKSKARTRAEIDAVRAHLSSRWRDVLDFLASTGAHTSEAERFAVLGTIEDLPAGMKRAGVAGVVTIPKTKTGGSHKVAVSKPGLAAAKRLLAGGPFDQSNFRKALAEASAAAGIPKLTPGTLRHSVATAAVNAGTDMEAVADALHHADKRTTARWYATLAVPAKIPTLL